MKKFDESNIKRSKSLKQYWANKKDHTSPNKGKSYIDLYGEEKAKLIKSKISKKMQGDNNPAKREIIKLAISNTARENFRTGKRKLPINNTAKGHFRPDINQYVRSNWEVNIIRIFNFYKIKFEYEKPIPIILNE